MSYNRDKLYKIRASICIGLVLFVLLFGALLRQVLGMERSLAEQAEIYQRMDENLATLYVDYEKEVPVDEINDEKILEVETDLEKLKHHKYDEAKTMAVQKIASLRAYAETRVKILELFDGEVLKVETTDEEIAERKTEYDGLDESYRKVLQKLVERMQGQYDQMVALKTKVRALFADDAMTNVAKNTTRAQYNEAVALADAIPQRSIAQEYAGKLTTVNKVLQEREEAAAEAARRAAEARRRAAELEAKRQREIAEAWTILNVPYISQNHQQLYNACEVASLLMALQYKGYLAGMDLRTYTEMVPKSDDPFQGFYLSISDVMPRGIAHWIAPAPLVKFGRETSGNENIIDATGWSLDQLDAEVKAGNPVVIWTTYAFTAVKGWSAGSKGAPDNTHTVVLNGYNSVSGTQRITDPWTRSNGATTWDLPKAELEHVYNTVGKRAVVVR